MQQLAEGLLVDPEMMLSEMVFIGVLAVTESNLAGHCTAS